MTVESLKNDRIKLKSVEVERDYTLNSILKVVFSKCNISVIYGENGCGKTTILKLINAFLAQNDSIFEQEKVLSMSITFSLNGEENKVSVKKSEKEEVIKDEDGKAIKCITRYYDWEEYRESKLSDMTSILFGVNRGITTNSSISEDEICDCILKSRFRRNFKDSHELIVFSHMLKRNLNMNERRRRGRKIRSSLDLSASNLNIDSISMDVIEEVLVERYRIAKMVINDKVRKALFDTLADACDSLDDNDITEEKYHEVLLKNKDRLISALSSGETNTLSDRIVEILKNVDEQKDNFENSENPLLKKLIVNMSKELNKESGYIQAINKLEEVFNEYIGPKKFLQITDESVTVKFCGSEESHRIEALSSGERHLLVLLTIFVIEGNRRQLFMVDEPEISLNMIWQRKLLPLLGELAPNAEIIVASHSPSIARANSNYLVGVNNGRSDEE